MVRTKEVAGNVWSAEELTARRPRCDRPYRNGDDCGCPPLVEAVPPRGYEFPDDGPFADRKFCVGVALGTVRAYAQGVEVEFIARMSGLNPGHVGWALQCLEREGLVSVESRTIPWYYDSRPAHRWRENPVPQLLGQPLPSFTSLPNPSLPTRIPPQFWWMFWSGTDPMFLSLPEHAWYVASRMLVPNGSMRYPPAETWALNHLPPWALRKLLDSRGYGDSPVASRIRWKLCHSEI